MIIACCGVCGFIFDIGFGNDCPSCQATQWVWASKLDDPEKPEVPWPHVLVEDGTRCRYDCIACAWLRRDKPEILWLDKLYELEDTRWSSSGK